MLTTTTSSTSSCIKISWQIKFASENNTKHIPPYININGWCEKCFFSQFWNLNLTSWNNINNHRHHLYFYLISTYPNSDKKNSHTQKSFSKIFLASFSLLCFLLRLIIYVEKIKNVWHDIKFCFWYLIQFEHQHFNEYVSMNFPKMNHSFLTVDSRFHRELSWTS